MAPELLKKSITISPLVAVGVSLLMLISTVVIAWGAMNRDTGRDSKQIEINTGLLKSLVEVRMPNIYSEIGQLKIVDMQNSTRYESIDKRLETLIRAVEKLQDSPSRIQYPVRSQTLKKE
jgi:hypothetical protein